MLTFTLSSPHVCLPLAYSSTGLLLFPSLYIPRFRRATANTSPIYPPRHSHFLQYTMADLEARKLDLRVGGKYRLGKKIGSGSFGMWSLRVFLPPTLVEFQYLKVTSILESISYPAKKSRSS